MADRPPPAGRLIALVAAVGLAPLVAAAGLAPLVAALWLALAWAVPSAAVQPDEVLADPALEARAREIGRELRCVVCQNQSIDDSDADLARDLRVLVRERLRAGDSDRQVLDYVVSRYGNFVLLRPPFKPETWALWLGPAAILGLGTATLVFYFRRRGRRGGTAAGEPLDAAGEPLDAADERRVARLLEERAE
jgi:cytochrome c-type biogenesis protein CcmH